MLKTPRDGGELRSGTMENEFTVFKAPRSYSFHIATCDICRFPIVAGEEFVFTKDNDDSPVHFYCWEMIDWEKKE